MKMLIWLLVILVLAMFAYVRLAPADVTRWHIPVSAESDRDFAAGAVRVIEGDASVLAKVDAAARALPRRQVLAGSVDEGRITYVTRSKVVGFPDYTTVELEGGTVRMLARLRFGRSDLGVNAARLQKLVAAAQEG